MFGLFQRRVSIRKYLPAGVDAHSHILPGVDDGAADMETALGIIRHQQQLGFRGAICTPHIMSRFPDNTPAHLRTRFAELLCSAHAAGLQVADSGEPAPAGSFRLHLAAEYMLDAAFLPLLDAPQELLSIPAAWLSHSSTESDGGHEGVAYLLLELPQYMLPEGWQDALDAVRSAGLCPLLAHPERYHRLLSAEELAALHRRQGVRYQGNLGSLAGLYGPQVQRLARRLHKLGLYTTWGTDAHSPGMLASMNLAAS